ncbi:hypothetical protein FBULB1_9246 [Fusarium bulbicola]|nr:hypothetical protein FBULB1_9246 [Fusarium bulbicola]
MAGKMTKGMWFNPIVIDDDQVKLEDDPLPSTLPLSNTLPLPNDPPVTNGPLAGSLPTTYPPVRFGTMRTRNQLSRLLQE